MSYLSYFGFDGEPFSHAPSQRFYFASAEHTAALRRLLYCVESMQGLAVLVGDSGRGKTTLARRLLDALPESQYVAAMIIIVHKDVESLWLLKHIASQLGVVTPAADAPSLIAQLYQQLVFLHDSGKRAVVLVDEAQMLKTQQLMEEFRGLLNLEVAGHKLISFVFFGLPELDEVLRLDPPLAQRVAMRCVLRPLDAVAAASYVLHRLNVVGGKGESIFPPEALAEIYRYSQGVPRLINTLCDNVLLELFFAQKKKADIADIQQVARNLGIANRVSLTIPEQLDNVVLERKSDLPSIPATLPLDPVVPPSTAGLPTETWGAVASVGDLLSNAVPYVAKDRKESLPTARPTPPGQDAISKVSGTLPIAIQDAELYAHIDLHKVQALLEQLNHLGRVAR